MFKCVKSTLLVQQMHCLNTLHIRVEIIATRFGESMT
jgi:hypothetical protein